MLTSFLVLLATAQPVTGSRIATAVAQIKAIDNHAHPLRVTADGETDTEADALTVDGIELNAPLPIRPDNPELVHAWRALYGYGHTDMSPAHVNELLAAKQRVMAREGNHYPAWVLDKAGIDTMIANRVAMGRGLTPPRFRWVSFVDALLFPLNNGGARSLNPEYDHFYRDEERLLLRYAKDSGQTTLPSRLKEYLARIVLPTLDRQKREGVLAVKFEAGYLRKLDFGNPSEEEAERVYAHWVGDGVPPADEYKLLQDYLFRRIAREAGARGLAVHIHVIGGGVGSYYDVGGSNPVLLDSVFNDPTLRGTKFVLIHGGYPWTREVASLLGKPNVYADFSAQTFLLYPRALSNSLRVLLEAFPEKVLFGTDASPGPPEMSWEEQTWMTTRTARRALVLALNGMVDDGEITQTQAIAIAKMVLRENAIALYHLAP